MCKYLALFILILNYTIIQAQENYSISGIVKDASTGEVLISARITIPEIKKGALTNAYGFYSITLPEGDYKLQYSYVGYEPIVYYLIKLKKGCREINGLVDGRYQIKSGGALRNYLGMPNNTCLFCIVCVAPS